MGYHSSAYVMYGAEVATERVYRTSEWLESPAANVILRKWDVGYAVCGPYDNDFLFLCKHFQEAELGEYKKLSHPNSQALADDRLAIIGAATDLGLTLVDEPNWIVVSDLS